MNIVAIIIAVVLGFIVLKLVVGIVKFVLLAVIVFAAIAFLARKLG
jgi:hypothetical protein